MDGTGDLTKGEDDYQETPASLSRNQIDQAVRRLLNSQSSRTEIEEAMILILGYSSQIAQTFKNGFIRQLVPEDEIESIVIEAIEHTVLSFLNGKVTYRGPYETIGLLYTTARRKVMDFWRQQYGRPIYSLDKTLEDNPALDPATEEPGYAAFDVDLQKVLDLFAKAKLNQQEQLVFALEWIYEYKPREIARRTNITAPQVSRLLFRAKQKLQKQVIELTEIFGPLDHWAKKR